MAKSKEKKALTLRVMVSKIIRLLVQQLELRLRRLRESDSLMSSDFELEYSFEPVKTV